MPLVGKCVGLARDEYDLVFTARGKYLHVLDYDNRLANHRAVCGRDLLDGFDAVRNPSHATERHLPLCPKCVEENILFDLRTTDKILA